MKKIINLTIVMSLLMITLPKASTAQEDEPLLNIGLKGGVNYSWLNLDDVDDETGRVGYHAGLMARINFTDYLALQGEGLFTTKGSKVEYKNTFLNGDATLRLNYIEVPVLLVLKINENINIHAGPYVAFIVDANAKNNSSVDLFDFEEEVDKDNFKGTDYGLAAGIGAEVQNLFGGIRYNQGLEKIEKEKTYNGTEYTFTAAKNSMVQLYLGFVF